MDDAELLTRLVRLETVSEQLLTLAQESKQEQQRASGVIDAITALERRHVNLESAVRVQWDKVDPLIHSDPPLTSRVRHNEDAVGRLESNLGALVTQVGESRDMTRKLVLTVATFVIVGILNAIVQFGA